MAGSREPVFTNDEKVPPIESTPSTKAPSTDNAQNYMLAEIIKSVSPSPTTMLNLVMQLGAHQPRWDDMALPPGSFELARENRSRRLLTLFPGRSVNACRAAFEELKRSSGYSPLSQTTAPQTPLSAPIGPLRRPWQLETTTSYASAPPGRQLLPKTKSEGQAGVMAASQSSTTPGGQAKRKRGRPTKAEAQAKAESSAAASAGSLVRRESAITPRVANPGPSAAPSPALGPASAPATIASPSVEPQPQPQPKPSLPPTNRVPISAMITTPTTQKTSSHSGSSSGKRRRRKSMRSEQDDPREVQSEPIPMGPALQQRPQHQTYPYPHYESPYSRIEPDETPARGPGMRHYDDPLPGIPIGARLPPTPLPGSHPSSYPGSHPGSYSASHPGSHPASQPGSHPGSHPGYGPGPAHGDSHSRHSSRPPSR
jgi:hypothetical protein